MSRPQGRGGKSGGTRRLKTRVMTARGRKLSSTRWLQRQLNDPYVEEARRKGYRSRAAFKLKEIDDKYTILKPGMRVLDLGAVISVCHKHGRFGFVSEHAAFQHEWGWGVCGSEQFPIRAFAQERLHAIERAPVQVISGIGSVPELGGDRDNTLVLVVRERDEDVYGALLRVALRRTGAGAWRGGGGCSAIPV